MNIVDSLIALAAKVTKADKNAIKAKNKCEIIDYITEHYEGGATGPQGPKGDKGDPGIGLTGEAAALEVLASPESADTAAIATKVNEIITQLKARGISL